MAQLYRMLLRNADSQWLPEAIDVCKKCSEQHQRDQNYRPVFTPGHAPFYPKACGTQRLCFQPLRNVLCGYTRCSEKDEADPSSAINRPLSG